MFTDVKNWLTAFINRQFCRHDYVIEHYGNRCAIERCTKCGHVNRLGGR